MFKTFKTCKILISVFVLVGLSGCGQMSKVEAQITGVDEVCYKGVIYLQFASGVSVGIEQDGSIMKCEEVK